MMFLVRQYLKLKNNYSTSSSALGLELTRGNGGVNPCGIADLNFS